MSKKRIWYDYLKRQQGWCELWENLERGEGPIKQTWKQRHQQLIPPQPHLTGGGELCINDSLHIVCVQGCRLSDVWPCGLGSVWAGVLTFTFAPRDLYWGDRKHTSVKLSRIILYQILPGWSVYRHQWRGKHNNTVLRIERRHGSLITSDRLRDWTLPRMHVYMQGLLLSNKSCDK